MHTEMELVNCPLRIYTVFNTLTANFEKMVHMCCFCVSKLLSVFVYSFLEKSLPFWLQINLTAIKYYTVIKKETFHKNDDFDKYS